MIVFKPLNLFSILALLLWNFAAFGVSGITYHGRILRSDGSAVEGQFVGFRIHIMDGNGGSCELYQESHTKDMRNSGGAFAITIGDGSVAGTYNVSGVSVFDQLFQNGVTYYFSSPAGCVAAPYASGTRDGRKLLVQFRESPADPWEDMPLLSVNYVPFSFNAFQALQVGSHTTASLLRVENSGTPQSISALTPTQYTTLASILGGSYISSVSATAGQTTVNTASNVATVGLADVSGLTAGTYGSATQVPVFTVDAKGRITGVTNTNITGGGGGSGTVTGVTGSAPISVSASTTTPHVSISQATTSTDGYLSSTDWNTFNGKQTATLTNGNFWVGNGSNVATSVTMSGDATIANTGALTIANDAVTFAKMQNITDNRLLGRSAGSNGDMQEISVGTGLSLAAGTLSATGSTPGNASYIQKGIVQFDTDAATSGITVAAGVAKLATSGVTAATYGAADKVPVFTVDAFGRVTTVTDTNIAIAASQMTSGVLAIARGGTNSGTALNNDRIMISNDGAIVEAPAMTNGQLLIGYTGSNPHVAALTAGTGVTITNSAGGITIAATGTGGTVTGVTGSAPISVTASSTTPNVSISQANTTTDGYLSSTDWNTFNNKQTSTLTNGNTWVGNGSNVATSVTMSGDATIANTGALTIANDAVTFAKMQNITDNRLLGRSAGSNGDMQEISVGTGLSLAAGTLSATGSDTFAGLPCGNGYLPYRSAGAWTCIQSASANTASTIVSRDSSGNFTAGAGTFNTSVKLTDGAAGGQLTLSAPVAFTSYSLKFPAADGTANQVLKTDGSGNLSWSSVSSSGYANGGNAFGANATIGLTDAYRLDFLTNNSARMTIDSSGNVGIGTTSPESKFDIVDSKSSFSSAPSKGFRRSVSSTATISDSATADAGTNATFSLDYIGNATLDSTNATSSNGVATTKAQTLYVKGPIINANSTGYHNISYSSGIYVDTAAVGTSVTNAYGIYINAPSGAANNAAAYFNGNVGIGVTNPSYPLDINGSARATSFLSSSDIRLKDDVRKIAGLDLVLKMQGVQWKWKSDGSADAGVIAQEMEKIFPSIVMTDPNTGYKSVKYNALIAPLIESVKEVYKLYLESQSRTRELKEHASLLMQENQEMKEKINYLEEKNKSIEKDIEEIKNQLRKK